MKPVESKISPQCSPSIKNLWSEWLLFNTIWSIFQLYDSKNRLHFIEI